MQAIFGKRCNSKELLNLIQLEESRIAENERGIERVRDAYIEYLYPMTGREFNKSLSKYSRAIERSERRIKRYRKRLNKE